MSNIKYPEKRFLLNYDLSYDFFNFIGLNVLDITPQRKIFILETDKGKKILKYIDYDEERLIFLITCINSLSKKYTNIINLMQFSDGKYYIKWKDKKYVIMDMIEGRETTFTNILEVKRCTEEVAKMHLCSREVMPDIEDRLGMQVDNIKAINLKERFRKSLNNMEFLRYSVSRFKYKNEFDELFIKTSASYVDDIKKAKDLLDSVEYDDYVKDKKNLSLCHNDLINHNFLIHDNKISIIDFEYATIDMSIIDLGDILLKGIKNVAFDFDKCEEIIYSYNNIKRLSDIEHELLYITLLYPRDIYSIIKSYYFKEKEWEYEVFLDRFNDKVENEQYRKEFLETYKEKYNI